MQVQPLIVTAAGRPPALNVLGAKVTVLAANTDTKAYEITFQQGDAEAGPPPHHHDWDESFYVLKGEVEFTCAGTTTRCDAGTLVHVPAGTVHSFHFVIDGSQMLEVTGAGGRAVQMFTAMDRGIPPGPPDRAKVVDVLAGHGVNLAV